PKEHELYINASELYRAGRYDDALKCSEKALEIAHDDPLVIFLIGKCLMQLQMFSKSLGYYNRLQEMESSSIVLLEIATNLFNLRKFHKSLNFCDQIPINDLEDKEIACKLLILKGNIFRALKRNKEAEKIFNELLNIAPNDIKVIYAKGSALRSIGKYEDAIQYYDKVLGVNPKHINALLGEGFSLFKLQLFHQSKECYEKVLEIDPNNSIARTSLQNIRKFENKKSYLSLEPLFCLLISFSELIWHGIAKVTKGGGGGGGSNLHP
ncbi:MAG: tetratricopeptide repeat protein, partial [bacterium]